MIFKKPQVHHDLDLRLTFDEIMENLDEIVNDIQGQNDRMIETVKDVRSKT